MMEFYANLHNHTTHSDGVYAPGEIVKVAKEEGYSAIAITDHDAATGYPELLEACRKENMECIFAVEFSVLYKDRGCHIVAFDFDPEYPPMKEYLRKMGARQTDNTKKCFDESVAEGDISGVTWEEIEEANKGVIWLCNNHVFKVMKKKGIVSQENYMPWFRKNFGARGGKYPPLYPFNNLPDMVKLIKEAGGFAVIAHPTDANLEDMEYLIECGIEGLEVWHPDLDEEQRIRAYKIALEKNLYISGGSDHSGFCGGLYDSFPTEEELKKSYNYIEPFSVGTTKEYFREIKERKLNMEYREQQKKLLGMV